MTDKDSVDRIPELDGVRGLAILLVLFYHLVRLDPVSMDGPIFKAIYRLAEMGWAGVDIFFVLSGFLITSILLRAKTEKDYFKNFYARRILRIFPLYYTTLTAIFLFTPLFDPQQAPQLGALWPWYYFYAQNWGNAFSLIPTNPYITITWSLAIEEQFYLFWPALVRRLSSRQLAVICSGLALFSLGLRVFVISVKRLRKLADYNKLFYFSTLTRFDSLLLGALLAVALQSGQWKKTLKPLAPVVFAAGLGLTGYFASRQPASPLVDNYPMFTYGYSVIALTAVALLVMLVTLAESNPLRRVFRTEGMRFFGKYSYAMYLFHMLVVTILATLFTANGWNVGILPWLLFILLSLGLTIVLSLLSWNLLEKRMLALKRHFEYQPSEG